MPSIMLNANSARLDTPGTQRLPATAFNSRCLQKDDRQQETVYLCF